MNTSSTFRAQPLVLMVDDDTTLRDVAQKALEQAGFMVAEAENGVQGLLVFDQVHPDIVLLDVSMPEMDGFQMCATLRQRPGGERTPIVMVTALEDIASITRAYEAGATDFITKPINWIILEHRLRYMLRASQAVEALHQSEARLRQAQKMEAIGTLAGGIAHDFNNILTAMLGYTELALHGVASGSAVWRNLQEVLTAGQRARDLVQKILIFSRHSEPERKPLALPLLMKEALKLLQASLPATIDIRVHLDPNTGMILANPLQMHQVLMNLCTNAVHAMREQGGVLEISLTTVTRQTPLVTARSELPPGSYVCLTIRDTGHGMTPEVLERIFEPFFTTKGVGEGTGMGLAVVHGIVTSHQGAITVESTPGQGTTFYVYLPQIDQAMPAEELSAPLLSARQGCILFVDDEEALAQLGQEILAPLGYDVQIYTNSREALEAFRRAPQHFDLVITDQTMPHLTGEALVRELRSIRPTIPIILCTGFSKTMTEEKAQELGIDAFLLKPFTLRDFCFAIQHVWEKRVK